MQRPLFALALLALTRSRKPGVESTYAKAAVCPGLVGTLAGAPDIEDCRRESTVLAPAGFPVLALELPGPQPGVPAHGRLFLFCQRRNVRRRLHGVLRQ